MKTIIHVNQSRIKHNRKTYNRKPVLTIKNYRETLYGTGVEIHGPSTLIYRPDAPLSCGAHVWIETTSEVTIFGEQSFKAGE